MYICVCEKHTAADIKQKIDNGEVVNVATRCKLCVPELKRIISENKWSENSFPHLNTPKQKVNDI